MILWNKIKKLSLRTKIITTLVIISIVTTTVALTINFSRADENSVYSTTQTIDGITFQNGRLEYKNGISTYTVDVVNDNVDTYNLKYINITFTKADNSVETLIGYIGETILKDEAKTLTASIDDDLTNVTKLTFSIVK